jgi:hypothetical protein
VVGHDVRAVGPRRGCLPAQWCRVLCAESELSAQAEPRAKAANPVVAVTQMQSAEKKESAPLAS